MDTPDPAVAAGIGSLTGMVAGWFLPSFTGGLSGEQDDARGVPGGREDARGVPAGRRLLAGLTTAAGFTVTGLRFGFGPLLPAVWYLIAAGVVLASIDIRAHRLPDRLTLPSYPVALLLLGGAALLVPGGAGHLLHALAGLAVAAAFYLLLAFLQPAGIGWGDVKLSGLLGLYLGWFGAAAVAAGLAGAFVLAAATGAGLIVAGRATRKTHIPFGPFMIAATVLVMTAGGVWPALSQ